MNEKVKYPRTFHLSESPNLQNDDRRHPEQSFFNGKEIVATVKMDGENTTIYSDGSCHARSLDSSYHPSREYVRKLAGDIGYLIPEGWRICGENLYAEHSIKYEHLEDYFYVFSIWDDKNRCLDWDETVLWASLLGLKVVPVVYRGIYSDEAIQTLIDNVDSLQKDPVEGFVIRTVEGFPYPDDRVFMNLAKWVRKNHVQTDEHWLNKPMIKNELISK